MPITPDPKWLEALKLPVRVMIGVTLAASGLLWLDYKKIIDLSAFGNLSRPGVVILCVVASALTISGVGAVIYDLLAGKRKEKALSLRRELRKKDEEEQSEKATATALERLDYLSEEELHYLADCLRKHSQSFTTWVHSSGAATLTAKRLIYSPGGTHHQDHYPFVVADFAWKELLRREEEFIARDDKNAQQREAHRGSSLTFGQMIK
jgi:hypothetical protein